MYVVKGLVAQDKPANQLFDPIPIETDRPRESVLLSAATSAAAQAGPVRGAYSARSFRHRLTQNLASRKDKLWASLLALPGKISFRFDSKETDDAFLISQVT
jgi:hypothetical protein